MKIGEDATLATDLPRALAQHGDHVTTIDALEDHVQAVVTDLFTAGTGKPWERT